MAVNYRISELQRSNPMSYRNDLKRSIGQTKVPVNQQLPGDEKAKT